MLLIQRIPPRRDFAADTAVSPAGDAVISALSAVRHALLDARFIEATPDLVGITEGFGVSVDRLTWLGYNVAH
jgi:hypothetical protein